MLILNFRIVNLIGEHKEDLALVWDTIRSKKMDVIDEYCTDDMMDKQVAFLSEKLGADTNHSTTNANLSLQNLQEAAKVYMFISFCESKTEGQVFLESLVEHEDYYHSLMKNISKLEEKDKFRNWYNGYSKIQIPYFRGNHEIFNYEIRTFATTGTIKTGFWGDKFDPSKIERKFAYRIYINLPEDAPQNKTFTLTLDMEKISMNVSRKSSDLSVVQYVDYFDNENNVLKNYNLSSDKDFYIRLDRDINTEDINMNSHLKTIPGFFMTWSYLQKDLKSFAYFFDYKISIAFRR